MVEAREVLPVAPDVLEEVEGLLQPVGLIVFPDHHVVAATGHHENNGCYICGEDRGRRNSDNLVLLSENQ